ncbi:LysM peptidoglycan-binding domain-containing protein [Sphingomonas baiyangensis]|uniref:LysM peptidoglycan-binding domain-containing protein n=2 Tax=Sphingomonas baiyangensis TaxID=2572576 RepID=A0A4U1L5D5_9SPHN|nr:LysM peptidoglycan-binding domain-containing protein [Sphingomonas baiyangensis]
MGVSPHRLRGTVALAAMLAVAGCIPGRDAAPPSSAPPVAGTPEPVRRAPDEEVRTLPAPPPSWEARAVNADARRVTATSYTVTRGDTLRGIAERTGAGSEAIARANGLAPPFTIFPGQQLSIPSGRYHLVRAGQTGIAIARAYGVEWSRVVGANALEEPYILRTGQRVLIPDDALPRSVAERARAFELDIDDILTGGQPAIAENAAPARAVATPRRVLPASAAVAAPAAALRGGFQWPVDGRVTRRFGPGRSGERNDGIKIAVPLETPVLAAADGTVAYAGSDIPSLGGVVILRHGSGLTSVYGHAGQLLVQRGQAVKRGQTIALSGDTGAAERPEVHFELRQGRTPIDPLGRLPRR